MDTIGSESVSYTHLAKGNTDYEKVVSEIDAAIEKSNPIRDNYTWFREVFQGGIESVS